MRPLPRLHRASHADALLARRVYGITDSADEGLFGGWAQAIYLEPGVAMARLPDAVALDDYIGGGCGLLTAVHIAERAEIRLGDAVVVQGAGAVGLSAIALARARRRLDGHRHRRAGRASRACPRRWAPTRSFDLDTTTPAERHESVRAATHGEGADVVIEAAGSAHAIGEGLDLARDGGRYVIAGHYTDVGQARSTRTSRSTASTSRSAAAGAARRGTSCARSACWSVTPAHPVAACRRPPLRAVRTQRGARRRRSDAHSESAGRSVGMTRHTKIIATLGPASSAPERHRRADRRRASTCSG